ncbi:MAG: c-type cytochrome [Alphaproteobacteria bacterium]|nr:c-type cytochrome [Alphaproteobacteria bacterium]
MRRVAAVLSALLALAMAEPRAAELLDFSAAEIARILRHGPWPQPFAADPGNRVSGNRDAVALGRALFFETRLAPDRTLSCATCHEPALAWSDGRPRSQGRVALTRNAPSLLDVRLKRWFGWDGGHDTLWSMSLRPIVDPKEIGGSAYGIADLLRGDPTLSACYARAFGRGADGIEAEALAVDAAKALAAFQETLDSPRTPFDGFRDALGRGDVEAAARLPVAAQRGTRLFVGRGNCAVCHLGPAFTNGEFHDIGIPYFTPGGDDGGRHEGIKTLRESRLTLLGPWNDDPARATGAATRHVDPQHRNFGEFRVPSLRNAARTAPYMHNGSLATLRDVIRHYSDFDPERLHGDGEAILTPLKLDDAEIDDLAAFLDSLSSEIPGPDLSAGARCG